MGYNSTLDGEWTIHPPLNGKEIRALPTNLDVTVRIEEADREIDGDVVTVRQGVAIGRTHEDARKLYHLADHLRRMAAAIPRDREVLGYIVREGEEQGDVERFSVGPDGRVIAEEATLRWPDGTAVKR